ncbi:hypothetical protein C1645_820780 [Glomus cerebriforme]|uniref:Uncharacterized protein n=1 Tax=Glomus cerebriforme TaxID=658196 RepID=A0A397T624_9GLOM|nr:hypothetical protein C1645_820780 [Glomus cerebriforme]
MGVLTTLIDQKNSSDSTASKQEVIRYTEKLAQVFELDKQNAEVYSVLSGEIRALEKRLVESESKSSNSNIDEIYFQSISKISDDEKDEGYNEFIRIKRKLDWDEWDDLFCEIKTYWKTKVVRHWREKILKRFVSHYKKSNSLIQCTIDSDEIKRCNDTVNLCKDHFEDKFFEGLSPKYMSIVLDFNPILPHDELVKILIQRQNKE